MEPFSLSLTLLRNSLLFNTTFAFQPFPSINHSCGSYRVSLANIVEIMQTFEI
ncbi:hypothetical protein M758_6G085500 [Ceratodon purpureus]|nr:hypothetical protein M758_6G085500 [Ceratodon purpureus]